MGREERSASTASTPVTLFTRSKLSFLTIMADIIGERLQPALPEAEDRGGQEREHLHRVIGQHQVPEVKQLARREMPGEATHNPPSVLNVTQGYIERINVKILKGLVDLVSTKFIL